MPTTRSYTLLSSFVPDTTLFFEKLYLFIGCFAGSSAFKQVFPNQYPEELILLSLDEEMLRPKLLTWLNDPDASQAMAILIKKMCAYEGGALNEEEISAFAGLARHFSLPPLSQSRVIHGFNQLRLDLKLPIEKLNPTGICSELSALWFKARRQGGQALSDFFEIMALLSSYPQNAQLLTSEQLAKITQFAQQIQDVSATNYHNAEQYNYQRLHSIPLERSHSLAFFCAQDLENHIIQLLSSSGDSDTLFRITNDNHTISIFKQNGQLWFYDTNHPQGDQLIDSPKMLSQEIIKSFTFFINEKDLTYLSVNQYAITPLCPKQEAFLCARHAIVELNKKLPTPYLAYCLQRYDAGQLSQHSFLDRIHYFFGKNSDEHLAHTTCDYVRVFLEARLICLEGDLPFQLIPPNTDINAKHLFKACIHAIRFYETPALLNLLALTSSQGRPFITPPLHADLLETAIGSHNKEAIQYLLSHGWDVHSTFTSGFTPLTKAIGCEEPEMITDFLKRGADPNASISVKETTLSPLLFAVMLGQEDVVNILIDAGAVFDSEDNQYLALAMAVQKGHVNMVATLLAHYPHHQKNLTALNTLLLDAAKQGSIEMVHLLHAYGGDLNKAQTRDKKNLMQIASEAGHVALLEYLNAPHQDPRFSIDASNTKKLSLHKPDFLYWTLLHFACSKGQVQVATYLLEKGFSPLEEDINGKTPLHFAAIGNYVDVIKLIFQKYPRLPWFTPDSALHDAIQEDQEDSVEHLLENLHQQHIFLSLSEKMGLFSLAAKAHAKKAFELLAKTFDCFNDQKNVIEFLKTNAHLQFIITQFDALFFQNFVHSPQDIAKESIAGFDADHKTALHHACAQGDLSTVRTLIHVGAPLNVADNDGNTPLHLACANQYHDVVKLLLQQKAIKKSLKNNQQQKPITLARLATKKKRNPTSTLLNSLEWKLSPFVIGFLCAGLFSAAALACLLSIPLVPLIPILTVPMTIFAPIMLAASAACARAALFCFMVGTAITAVDVILAKIHHHRLVKPHTKSSRSCKKNASKKVPTDLAKPESLPILTDTSSGPSLILNGDEGKNPLVSLDNVTGFGTFFHPHKPDGQKTRLLAKEAFHHDETYRYPVTTPPS